MTYEAWRISYQSSEQAARAAYVECGQLQAKITEMEKQGPVGTAQAMPGTEAFTMACFHVQDIPVGAKLYALPGAQQCKNCNGMGDRFDPSGEKIPCDLCESHLEEIRALVAEAAHDIISGSDFWLSTSLAAKKIYALPSAEPVVTPKMEQAFYEKVEVTSIGSIRGLADGIKAAMLAATEAKP